MKLWTWTALVLLGWGGFSDLPARTITVAQTGTADHKFIEGGIAGASAGDTIRVAAGTYHEPGLHIDKSVTLLGAGPDSTIFRYGWGLSIAIVAEDVTIEGFTFHYQRDGRAAAARAAAMVVIDHSPIIRGNRFIGGFIGAFAALEVLYDAQPTIQYNEFLTEVGIRLRDNPNAIDARFNWWDTEERTAIQEKIWDGADEDGWGPGLVLFEPWLSAPGGPIGTAIRLSSWGTLKRMQLFKEE